MDGTVPLVINTCNTAMGGKQHAMKTLPNTYLDEKELHIARSLGHSPPLITYICVIKF